MNTYDNDVRWEALDALRQFKDPSSIEAIFPLLFNTDPNIRWKAIHTLGEIGDRRAIGRISLLLADEEENIQRSAANVLIKLGISEKEVESWENKAQKISIEEIYQSQLNYHRAVAEKEILNKKLENELITQGIALNHAKSLVGNKDPLSPDINDTAAKDKGGKDRVVYLSGDALEALSAYLRKRPPSRVRKIFLVEKGDYKGSPLSMRGIQKRMEYYARKAGLKVSCHQLRHTMATQLLNADADLVVIQDLLGHNQIRTTQRYCKVSNLKVQRDYHRAIDKVMLRHGHEKRCLTVRKNNLLNCL